MTAVPANRLLASGLLLSVAASGCEVARERVNSSCEWAFDPPVRLDRQSAGDERHLIRDAAVAEDLAIRYADAQRGFRSGHYAGEVEYAGTWERCLSILFEVIADQHGVAVQHVRPL